MEQKNLWKTKVGRVITFVLSLTMAVALFTASEIQVEAAETYEGINIIAGQVFKAGDEVQLVNVADFDPVNTEMYITFQDDTGKPYVISSLTDGGGMVVLEVGESIIIPAEESAWEVVYAMSSYFPAMVVIALQPVNPEVIVSQADHQIDHQSCTHSFEWEEETAATETADGVMAYVCTKCGAVGRRMTGGTAGTSAFAVFNQNIMEEINKAQNSETLEINTGLWTSFPQKVMEAIAARRDVSLEITYRLAGKTYRIIIPAGAAVPADVEWAGFDGYLAGLYGKEEVLN